MIIILIMAYKWATEMGARARPKSRPLNGDIDLHSPVLSSGDSVHFAFVFSHFKIWAGMRFKRIPYLSTGGRRRSG